MTVTAARLEPLDPAAPTPPAWTHVPGLDGLRAAAVIAVLVFHAGYLQGGFLGVDLFFALSGFLITSLLIRDSEGGTANLMTFWGRRFRRLLPAVFVMIAVIATWSWWFGSPADLDGVKSDGPWAVVYMANWHFIADSAGYWASFAQPGMFDHLWSLAIEEQFYVLWPLAVAAIWAWSRRPQRVLVVVAIVGSAVSLVTMLVLYQGGDPTRVYMGTDTRAASLLVGALAATAPARALARRVVARLGDRIDLVIGAIAAGILWSWFAIDGASASALYRGGLLLHSVACATIVVLVATAPRGRSLSALGWRPLTWIGVLSYGLYLWHWPLYVIMSPERMGIDGVGLAVIRIAASFVAAYVSYRIVEDPLRHRVPWVRGRPGVIVLVASVIGLLTYLFLLPEPETEIASFDPTIVTIAPSVPAGDAASDDTVAPGPTDDVVVADDAGDAGVDDSVAPVVVAPLPERRTISSAIWAGDSVAFDLAPAVDVALTDAGLTMGAGSYPGIRLLGPDDSLRLTSQLDDRIVAASADTVLIVVSTWDADVDDDDYAAGLRELADMLPSDGQLIVVSSPPTGDDDVNADLDRLAGVAVDVAAASDGHIVFLDASGVWSDPAVLDENGDGAPERKRDLIHVCPAGAANFAAWLATTLDADFDGLDPVDPAQWAGGEWVSDPRYDEPVGACAPVG
ncbi:MAG: acyltransferase [Ilumatobacteraceae bacterium]